MTKKIVTTIKGGLNTSINILLNEIHQVGDTISFDNITNMVPSGEDYTKFFYSCISFCRTNGTRLFRIDNVSSNGQQLELQVSPIFAKL